MAQDQNVTTVKDTAKVITLVATDADGNTLTYLIVTQSSHGTLSGTAPSVTYTPNANYTGSDSFTFKANDGKADSNTATVSITVNAVNVTCLITSPTSGATFIAPATVTINANASDSDGTVAKVEFYQGATKLGEDTTSPYSYTWNSVAAGTYSLTVKATDNSGASTTSVAVSITVNSGANNAPTIATAAFANPNPVTGVPLTEILA
jgi:type IV secretory pathway VirJ component